MRSDDASVAADSVSGVFGRIDTLGLECDSTARALLKRAAKAVKPLMIQRGWYVSELLETYPPFAGLLGLNHEQGRRIELRLRHPTNVMSFLDYNCILDTLLHELVHIEIGPHDDAFYKLRKQLYKDFLAYYPDGPTPGGCRNAMLAPLGLPKSSPKPQSPPAVLLVRPVLVDHSPVLGAIMLVNQVPTIAQLSDNVPKPQPTRDDATPPLPPVPPPPLSSSSLTSFAHRSRSTRVKDAPSTRRSSTRPDRNISQLNGNCNRAKRSSREPTLPSTSCPWMRPRGRTGPASDRPSRR